MARIDPSTYNRIRMMAKLEAVSELKKKLDLRLNSYLIGMKPDHDDSITGFNAAWKVMDAVFKDITG